jgi:hypothetical protein
MNDRSRDANNAAASEFQTPSDRCGSMIQRVQRRENRKRTEPPRVLITPEIHEQMQRRRRMQRQLIEWARLRGFDMGGRD